MMTFVMVSNFKLKSHGCKCEVDQVDHEDDYNPKENESREIKKPRLYDTNNTLNKNILNKWNIHIKKKQWANLVTSLLENHYDPTYKNNFDEKNQKVYKSIFLDYIDKKNINIVTKKILKR